MTLILMISCSNLYETIALQFRTVIARKLDWKSKETEGMQLYGLNKVSNSIISKASGFQCAFEWSKSRGEIFGSMFAEDVRLALKDPYPIIVYSVANYRSHLKGCTRSIHDGGGGEGSDLFFWVGNLHPRYFFGSRDLPRICLGRKKNMCIFWDYTSPREISVAVSGSDNHSFELFSSSVRVTEKIHIKKIIQCNNL